MKITIAMIKKQQRNLYKMSVDYLKQTMKSKNLGLKDAYQKCKVDYSNNFHDNYSFPI